MSQPTYKELKAKLLKTGKSYVDDSFPRDRASLRRTADQPAVVWKRPGELVQSPKFLTEGATKFDLNQGELGDCWYVAGAACVAGSNLKLIGRCAPLQSFTDGYAGIFHFNFWYFGHWTEVVIDDRLPTFNGKLLFARNKSDPNEFWAPLMEKAYAKLYGSYANINGGHISTALVNFTGGLSEFINLSKQDELPTDLFDIMMKTFKMNSLLGCGIDTETIPEARQPNGLYKGHAYSITHMAQGTIKGRKVRLLRLRNPWGEGEWNGAWSDYSADWTQIKKASKDAFGYKDNTLDGEFWMSFEDWLANFHSLRLCHLYPDALTSEIADDTEKRDWKVTYQKGSWIKGVNAGGCQNYQTYWTNPQILFTPLEADDADNNNKCTTIMSLMQINADNQEDLYIAFTVYIVNSPKALNKKTYSSNALVRKAESGVYTNLREVTARMQLVPGALYVIIPATYYPSKAGGYMLRIYTEKMAASKPIEEENVIPEPPQKPTEPEEPADQTDPEPNEPKKPKTEMTQAELAASVFNKYSGSEGFLGAMGVRIGINEILKDKAKGTDPVQFSIFTARALMGITDRNQSGGVDAKEFETIIEEMLIWKAAFGRFDRNSSGNISAAEMKKLFEAIGLSLSTRVLNSITTIYGDDEALIDLEEFMIVCSKLIASYKMFKNLTKTSTTGKASLSLDEWLTATMFF